MKNLCNDSYIVRLISFGPFISILFIVAFVTYLTVQTNSKIYAINLQHIETYYMEQNQDLLKSKINYEVEFANNIEKHKKMQYDIYKQGLLEIYLCSFIILVISVLASIYVSRKIRTKFNLYEATILIKNNQLKSINKKLEQKVNDRTKDLENANKKLKELATVDFLTQIHNRYSFIKYLEEEINRSQRYDMPFALLMFDIDYFKKINDTYGHDVGDSILIELSSLISKHLRVVDIFGRIGGEEFMILLPNTTIKNGAKVAENLRIAVEKHSFQNVRNVTISFGVTSFEKNITSKQLFKHADIALYQAKNSGRNKTVIYQNTL